MKMNKNSAIRIHNACLVVGLLLLSVVAAGAQSRMIAIGDVHGAYPEFVSILQRTGLIDADRKWIGGSAVLIQTGDLLDRGRQSRDCIDLLMGIEREATRSGGKVIPLLGNHEVLNIVGDMRYVAADAYRSFATSRSSQKREQAYRDYLKFLSAHRAHAHAGISADAAAARGKWEDEHPPGYFEYRDAFGPGGKYGAWFRMHNAVLKAGNGLFVHGGLYPLLQFSDIAELNDRIRSELASFDTLWQTLVRKKVIWRYMNIEEAMLQVNEGIRWMQAAGEPETSGLVKQMRRLLDLNNWMIFSREGPLWYRGLAQGQEVTLMEPLKEMLQRLDAQYLVAGHTVLSKTAITTHFDNRVFLIDTGMLKEAYGGRASALEIQNGRFTAFYADGEPEILATPEKKSAAEIRKTKRVCINLYAFRAHPC